MLCNRDRVVKITDLRREFWLLVSEGPSEGDAKPVSQCAMD